MMVDWKADIICLQETKLEGDIYDIIKQIWGGRWIKFAQLEASSTRRGILMLQDSRIWNGEILEIRSYTLTYKFEEGMLGGEIWGWWSFQTLKMILS